MAKSKTVRNKNTGQEHTVPDGHFSLNDPDNYEIVKPKPARKSKAKPKAVNNGGSPSES